MLWNYNDLKEENYVSQLEIQIKNDKQTHIVEFFDGVRVDNKSIPNGKYMYHTRHADNDMSQPVSIAPNGETVLINFCGTIVSDEVFDIKEETEIIDVNWL